MTHFEKRELIIIFGVIGIYLLTAAALFFAVQQGYLERSPAKIAKEESSDSIDNISSHIYPALESAKLFFTNNFVNSEGHIDLYITHSDNLTLEDRNTNSEAISYYLLWTAQENNKKAFDRELEFVEENMLHPTHGYMMWRLNESNEVEGDGGNIATDADLRTIKALLIAEKQWKDPKYTELINTIAAGMEKVAITPDGYLAPYGGASGENDSWTSNEVWLSYTDFTVLSELSDRRGAPWTGIYSKMKSANLNAQLENGLYNSMLTNKREYGNGIDGGGYSINSLWIMVRNAESSDEELMNSANKSLQFYKNKFQGDMELYGEYGSNGDALSPYDTPWVYALVGRAAIALEDYTFSREMLNKLIEHQITDKNSSLYGALPEGFGNQSRIGQFTMQESIITMQDYEKKKFLQ